MSPGPSARVRSLQVRGRTSYSIPDPVTPGNAALGIIGTLALCFDPH